MKKKIITIMIVEDEAIIAMLLKKKLSQYGYKVIREVSSGKEAIEWAKKEKPMLILMDIRLSGYMDGIEVAKNIIVNEPSTYVIFITGYSTIELEDRAKQLNPIAYLKKPLQIEQLNKIINDLF